MPYGIASSPEKGELFLREKEKFIFLPEGSPLEGRLPPLRGEDVTVGDKRGNLARQRLRGFSYTSSFAYWALVSIKRRRGST